MTLDYPVTVGIETKIKLCSIKNLKIVRKYGGGGSSPFLSYWVKTAHDALGHGLKPMLRFYFALNPEQISDSFKWPARPDSPGDDCQMEGHGDPEYQSKADFQRFMPEQSLSEMCPWPATENT